MENFEYYIPTMVCSFDFELSQKDMERIAIRENGGNKVLLVYGSGSIKRNGIYSVVLDELIKGNLEWIECGVNQEKVKIRWYKKN